MDKIIVYLDDVEHARHLLAPMESGPSRNRRATHWILVACPPRMTRHIGRWVTHTARQNWRSKWAEKLFAGIAPWLQTQGDTVTPVLAHGPLVLMTAELLKTYPASRVLDARRPKFGEDLPPVTGEQPTLRGARWSIPGSVAGMGAFLVLVGE